MRSKLLPVYLPQDEYVELCRTAKAEERDPIQQARWLIRCALLEHAKPPRDVVTLETGKRDERDD